MIVFTGFRVIMFKICTSLQSNVCKILCDDSMSFAICRIAFKCAYQPYLIQLQLMIMQSIGFQAFVCMHQTNQCSPFQAVTYGGLDEFQQIEKALNGCIGEWQGK